MTRSTDSETDCTSASDSGESSDGQLAASEASNPQNGSRKSIHKKPNTNRPDDAGPSPKQSEASAESDRLVLDKDIEQMDITNDSRDEPLGDAAALFANRDKLPEYDPLRPLYGIEAMFHLPRETGREYNADLIQQQYCPVAEFVIDHRLEGPAAKVPRSKRSAGTKRYRVSVRYVPDRYGAKSMVLRTDVLSHTSRVDGHVEFTNPIASTGIAHLRRVPMGGQATKDYDLCHPRAHFPNVDPQSMTFTLRPTAISRSSEAVDDFALVVHLTQCAKIWLQMYMFPSAGPTTS